MVGWGESHPAADTPVQLDRSGARGSRPGASITTTATGAGIGIGGAGGSSIRGCGQGGGGCTTQQPGRNRRLRAEGCAGRHKQAQGRTWGLHLCTRDTGQQAHGRVHQRHRTHQHQWERRGVRTLGY
jgi:hypothetical protein